MVGFKFFSLSEEANLCSFWVIRLTFAGQLILGLCFISIDRYLKVVYLGYASKYCSLSSPQHWFGQSGSLRSGSFALWHTKIENDAYSLKNKNVTLRLRGLKRICVSSCFIEQKTSSKIKIAANFDSYFLVPPFIDKLAYGNFLCNSL